LNQLKEVDEVEVLYLFDETHWANGYATEAARASIRYGFELVALDHIVGLVHPENIPSRQVLEKVDLTCRGRERHFNMDLDAFEISRTAFVPDGSEYRVLT
jgi:ribosomal-protein-alanine N-acetyltransferase